MTKFNYEEKGCSVALMKPSIDTRDGADIIKSRIGLEDKGILIPPSMDVVEWYLQNRQYDVLVIDEAQFLTSEQIDQLKEIAVGHVPVLCFGLRTDFRTYMFPASKRLFELADSLTEIKSVCKCGRKAEVNARIQDGKIVKTGEQVFLGGSDHYIGMCYQCWKEERL